jgi:hypothetical protein
MDTRATTVRFPADLHDAITEALGYGDSLNGWVLDACRERLDRPPAEPVAPAPAADPSPTALNRRTAHPIEKRPQRG